MLISDLKVSFLTPKAQDLILNTKMHLEYKSGRFKGRKMCHKEMDIKWYIEEKRANFSSRLVLFGCVVAENPDKVGDITFRSAIYDISNWRTRKNTGWKETYVFISLASAKLREAIGRCTDAFELPICEILFACAIHACAILAKSSA